jgi:hypothetical protein
LEKQNTHLGLVVCSKGPGELSGESALANPTLAAEHEELMLDILHAISYERESRIGPLWLVCGADFLVCTSRAGVRLAGLVRVDALGGEMVIEVILVFFLVVLAGQ